MRKSAKGEWEKGFTLLELVVAVSLSVLLLLGIIRMVSMSLDISIRTVERLGAIAEQERIQERVQSDLQSMWQKPGWQGMVWAEMPVSDPAARGWDAVKVEAKPAHLEVDFAARLRDDMKSERWGLTGVRIGWFVQDSAKAIEDPGGIKAVSYQIMRKRVSPSGTIRYFLARAEVSARNTLDAGYALDAPTYQAAGAREAAYWSASVLRHPGNAHLIAANVIDFGVRAYQRDGHGQWQLVYPAQGRVNWKGEVPERWVVMLRILSDAGAQQIENLEQGRIDADWWTLAQRHSRVHCFQVQVLR